MTTTTFLRIYNMNNIPVGWRASSRHGDDALRLEHVVDAVGGEAPSASAVEAVEDGDE